MYTTIFFIVYRTKKFIVYNKKSLVYITKVHRVLRNYSMCIRKMFDVHTKMFIVYQKKFNV